MLPIIRLWVFSMPVCRSHRLQLHMPPQVDRGHFQEGNLGNLLLVRPLGFPSGTLGKLWLRRSRLLFLAEFLEARVIPERIKHGIEP